ncbi:N-acetyltransferase [Pedobacter yonginense]|uniref:N-acetyltransferase n=1 Tax=Pedobacter yonginense TaxID=651869 RepID=A0A317EKF5_9SPHI|nr:GNAT family N-acetyltransferase [Pedobacter yonginense]PWS27311.1 N-acetyltransferase [Pedobacter yonginense]
MKNIKIKLTSTKISELGTFFEFQLDEEARYLAAFTPKKPLCRDAYIEKYTKHLADPNINMKTIWLNDVIVGSLAKFVLGDEAELTYWIEKKFWGMGVASSALKAFLEEEKSRPIFGRVAFDNYGSQKVLEHCGFRKVGQDKGFANARQAEIDELIYKL